jgi:F-type H+-transporting ATPase subunit epsilon
VTILARICERAEEIDVGRAEAERRRAEEQLARARADVDMDRARASLMKAMVRLQVASRARTRS